MEDIEYTSFFLLAHLHVLLNYILKTMLVRL